MKKKDSFVLYTSQTEAVRALSDEDAGRLLKAIYSYHLGEGVAELAPLPNLVFLMMRPIFERDAAKWEETARKRREAGAKGGKARAGGASAEESALPELEQEIEPEAELSETSPAKQNQAKLSNAKQSQAQPSTAKQAQTCQANQAVIGIGIGIGIGNGIDTHTKKDLVDISEPDPVPTPERGVCVPFSPEDVEEAKDGIRREADAVRQEFEQLREAYKAVRDDGPMAGWPEYQQARRSKGWPGLLIVLDRLQTLVEQDAQWKRGYKEGLRRFLTDRMWEMEPRKDAPAPGQDPEPTDEEKAVQERIERLRAKMKADEEERKAKAKAMAAAIARRR